MTAGASTSQLIAELKNLQAALITYLQAVMACEIEKPWYLLNNPSQGFKQDDIMRYSREEASPEVRAAFTKLNNRVVDASLDVSENEQALAQLSQQIDSEQQVKVDAINAQKVAALKPKEDTLAIYKRHETKAKVTVLGFIGSILLGTLLLGSAFAACYVYFFQYIAPKIGTFGLTPTGNFMPMCLVAGAVAGPILSILFKKRRAVSAKINVPKLEKDIQQINSKASSDASAARAEIDAKYKSQLDQLNEKNQELVKIKDAAVAEQTAFLTSTALSEFTDFWNKAQAEYDAKLDAANNEKNVAYAALVVAQNLSSTGSTYQEDDFPKLTPVIEKLESGRATTLAEALNGVDADEFAQAEAAKAEAHRQQVMAQEMQRTADTQAANAEMLRKQAESAARQDAHNAAMLQAQQQATEQQRLHNEAMQQAQKDYQAEQRASAEAKQQAKIEANYSRCKACAFISRVNSYGWCSQGGCNMEDSGQCLHYRSAY